MINTPFNKIGLALTFSPSMKYNLKTALHLKELFNSELCIIHSSQNIKEDKKRFESILNELNVDLSSIKLLSKPGDPAKVILEIAEKEKIDLLIAGALEKENLLKQYIGSVSRKLMNEAKCSVLILRKSEFDYQNFKKFCVVVNYTSEYENALVTAYRFAELEKAKIFSLIRDLWIPGLSLTNFDDGSINSAESAKKELINDETDKIKIFIKELNIGNSVPIRIECFYEKNSINLSSYVKQHNADVLVISKQTKKSSIFNRLIVDEFKNIYDDLPSNLLIIRK